MKQNGRKAKLIARAFGAYKLNVPIKFTQEQIYKKIGEEYAKRLKTNCLKTNPNKLPEQAWLHDLQKWPDIDDGKLFSYILQVKAVAVDYIGKYKDQKAYSYWMSGFVDTVYFAKCPSDGKFTFLKGNVSPTQKLHDDPPHKVWVCIKGTEKDCRIVTSWCTCTAGTAEVRNHVIALPYKVNYAFNKDFISPACTSIPQGWNKGTRREVTPTQLKNLLDFSKGQKTKTESNEIPCWNKLCKKSLIQENLKIER